MELRQIRYFIAVAKHLNFTKAAKECYISQSALSEQIRNLEKEFNCKFFERTSRKVSLTMDGKSFLNYCVHINQYIQDAKSTIGKKKNKIEGIINIATLQTIMLSWLPLLIMEFKKHFPYIQFVTSELGSVEVENSVKNHTIDLGITNLPLRDTSLYSKLLYKERLVLIVPERHHLTFSSKNTLEFSDLKNESFIIPEKGYDLRGIILKAFFESGYSPNIVIENGKIESVKYFVHCGLGIAFIPEIAVHYNFQKYKLKWFYVKPEILRPVGLVMRDNNFHSVVVNEFIYHLYEYNAFDTHLNS